MTRLVLAAALVAAPLCAGAQDNTARNLAASCALCHGTDGRSVTKEIASLASLPRGQIVEQMRAFRDGQRPATVMQQIAKGYSDAQIDAIAGWFAAQRNQP